MNLDAYAARIEYGGAFTPTLETLRALHFAHATHIPFENLDILLGKPILLDQESLAAKLIEGQRGGYCFEQNGLFAAVLEAAGFHVTRLAARVRMGVTELRPTSHMLLLVEAGGEPWIADVGFGGEGLLYPLPLHSSEVTRHFNWQYRILAEDGIHVLQSQGREGWADLYAFTLQRQELVDYEVYNHFTSTYPRSPFLNRLVVQMPGPEVRWKLVNRLLSKQTPEGTVDTVLPDDDAILATLAERFRLRFPAGTRFAYRELAGIS